METKKKKLPKILDHRDVVDVLEDIELQEIALIVKIMTRSHSYSRGKGIYGNLNCHDTKKTYRIKAETFERVRLALG
ncbi:MAG: hypothetical protein AABY15_02985 [Nanoarchaeota archaeon]